MRAFRRRSVMHFLCGMIAGVSLGLVGVCLVEMEDTASVASGMLPVDVMAPRDEGLRNEHLVRGRNLLNRGPEFAKANDTVARHLEGKIRVLCWIYLRRTQEFEKRRNITMNSWGNKCTKFLFFINNHNDSLPAIGLDMVAKSVPLSDSPMISAYRYVHKHHYNDADWFFSAEQIPFVIMENLRHFLSDKDPDEPIYYGHRMKSVTDVPGLVYADRCAGVILSRKGLHLLGTQGPSPPECNRFLIQSGLQFAKCMQEVGVRYGETRDSEGKSRMLLMDIGVMMSDYRSDPATNVDEEESDVKPSQSISSSLISFGRSYYLKNSGHHFFVYELIKIGAR
ncbi:glycoprotein-N-acetylgalactosamine 3-beta-galactosyltransferase 1-like isoform X1 [Haliotis rufescens]|uniref:glycoprotein-N-acetylgalactosamine 3-beta-galactosyltransferase 1-like isoform X1 n=1 Tax=Haliotis rufescens TaxID=6454 RepID=UPI00201E7AAB|nr:glycoprotein-N-acetylgalactosamine 3-beta-galactosyltransferase 1-like isoform X1 [Haliotis rufescens]